MPPPASATRAIARRSTPPSRAALARCRGQLRTAAGVNPSLIFPLRRDAMGWHMLLAAVEDNSVTRTLALALRTIGSLERLAEYLGVPEAMLRDCIEGRRDAPTAVYLRALDLVARGPFASPQGGKRGKKS